MIRRLTSKDFPKLREFFKNIRWNKLDQGGDWNVKKLEAEVPHGLYAYWRDSEIVAALSLRKTEWNWTIVFIGTLPSCRRQGYARRLVQHLCKEFKTTVDLEVLQSNSRAIRFYDSLGFRKVGLRKDYYGPGQSAILLSM